MADDSIAKQEFNLRNVLTRHVTLYPTRAHIVRDIHDIVLQPGANEITIHGITPTADEGSIKVEGKGAATITDMAVDIVPNKEVFEDIYPSDSESESDSDKESDGHDSNDDNNDLKTSTAANKESDEIKSVRAELRKVEKALADNSADQMAAIAQLSMLNTYYSKSLEHNRPNDLSTCMTQYAAEFISAEKTKYDCQVKASGLDQQRRNLNRILIKDAERSAKAENKANNEKNKEKNKAKAKADKEKLKALDKKIRDRKAKADAKIRLKKERATFWPRKTYRLVVSLDAGFETPSTSRRNSITSQSSVKPTTPGAVSGQISLSLSYITSSAFWTPRYDLSLNTPNATGTILYRSEYVNETSEVWKDAKVSLSTSEAAYGGLDETIPRMHPWTIQLLKNNKLGVSNDSDAALASRQEQMHQGRHDRETSRVTESRNDLFGLPRSKSQPLFPHSQLRASQNYQAYQAPAIRGMGAQSSDTGGRQVRHRGAAPAGFGQTVSSGAATAGFGPDVTRGAPPAGSLFGSQRTGGLFGSQHAGPSGPKPSRLFGAARTEAESQGATRFSAVPRSNLRELSSSNPQGQNDSDSASDSDADGPSYLRDIGGDDDTMIPNLPSLETEEATWAEEGLTFSYEIPGLRTISPSFTKRRFRVANIPLKNINLSYILIPKLRAAAFLKARLVNSSSVTLLKGQVGITLDGSFLGNTLLPRCSGGDKFSLSLGIDPAVQVVYARPTVKRSASGIIFQKDDNAAYSRSVTVSNTKPNRAIEGVILDQMPVSQEERLRTVLLRPAGLTEDRAPISDGRGVSKDGKVDAAGAVAAWGNATVALKPRGEVRWAFKIQPGKIARFGLEYETRCPTGERVISA